MSLSSHEQVSGRIAVATPESPISLYRTERRGMWDSVFGATAFDQWRRFTDSNYVGTFDRSHADEVRKIMAALG